MSHKTKRNSDLNKLPVRFEAKFFSDLDSRTVLSQEIRRRRNELIEATGAEESPQRRLLCDRCVFLSIRIETMEINAANGTEDFQPGPYVCLVNSLVGILKTLGLDQQVKAAGSLQDYLRERSA
ncbi:hypothetical protein Pan44_25080 [Caulifigura coniformis]|uniref:Uncharacterized protein n=1 Tax=Caulifigura coniformis TaxID=2527983 RepID=A0A517SEB6_9PLAN|nr:hypothetical protein [Caulifigura coniformis]QDT54475.1 hypothetical protein Pan44_25080 [Caulifigura coniformis]